MVIDNDGTDCCATGVINKMEGHPDPEEALKAFCKHFKRPAYLGGRSLYNVRTFYIFTGVEKLQDGKDPVPFGYCGKLARYIKKNKLGPVVQTTMKSNHLYHPYHLDKVFVWHPDIEALCEWWNKHAG
jgi:hypothetical protein